MRSMSAPALAALAGDTVPMVVLIEMHFDPVLYMCLADCNVEHDGHVWQGLGTAAGFDGVTDAASEKRGITMRLSSVPIEALNLALEENTLGKRVLIHVAIYDSATYQVLTVQQVFSGTLGQPKVSEEGGKGGIELTAETRSVTFRRVKALRLTNTDQQRLYPGDTSFQYITKQSSHQDVWPAASWYQQ